MDPNLILTFMTLMSCAINVSFFSVHRPVVWKRLIPSALVLGSFALTWCFSPQVAGYVAAVPWTVFMFIPGISNKAIHRCIAKRHFSLALFWAYVQHWTAPWTTNGGHIVFVNAIHSLFDGQFTRAEAYLEKLQLTDPAFARIPLVLNTRISGDWDQLRDLLSLRPLSSLEADPFLLDAYLQSLGETGRTEEMFATYQEAFAPGKKQRLSSLTNLTRMKLCAFHGAVEHVDELFEKTLTNLHPDHRLYWLATAEQARGHFDEAEVLLAQLDASDDHMLRTFAQRRRDQSVLNRVPSQEFDVFCNQFIGQMRHESDFAIFSSNRPVSAHATWLLAICLMAVFMFEIPGGSTDKRNMVEMGAFVMPISQVNGQYWRIFTAAFLHFGPLHLAFNVAGLIIFGKHLESAWGFWRTLVSYLVCAFGSIALMLVVFPTATEMRTEILVGASGGVMGLIGCLLGYMLAGVIQQRSHLVRREFLILLGVVIFQFCFDATSEAVSSKCHFLGLMIGAIIGITFGLDNWRRQRKLLAT